MRGRANPSHPTAVPPLHEAKNEGPARSPWSPRVTREPLFHDDPDPKDRERQAIRVLSWICIVTGTVALLATFALLVRVPPFLSLQNRGIHNVPSTSVPSTSSSGHSVVAMTLAASQVTLAGPSERAAVWNALVEGQAIVKFATAAPRDPNSTGGSTSVVVKLATASPASSALSDPQAAVVGVAEPVAYAKNGEVRRLDLHLPQDTVLAHVVRVYVVFQKGDSRFLVTTVDGSLPHGGDASTPTRGGGVAVQVVATRSGTYPGKWVWHSTVRQNAMT